MREGTDENSNIMRIAHTNTIAYAINECYNYRFFGMIFFFFELIWVLLELAWSRVDLVLGGLELCFSITNT